MREAFIGRRGRARTYVFELATSLAYPIVGVTYLAAPDSTALHSPVGRRVFPFDHLWSTGFILAGLLILFGVLWPRPRVRVAGLILMGTALLMQFVAAISIHPEPRECVGAIYALACLARAWLVVRLWVRVTGA